MTIIISGDGASASPDIRAVAKGANVALTDDRGHHRPHASVARTSSRTRSTRASRSMA